MATGVPPSASTILADSPVARTFRPLSPSSDLHRLLGGEDARPVRVDVEHLHVARLRRAGTSAIIALAMRVAVMPFG